MNYELIFEDAFFAAIAAIGFSAISRPPHRAYLWCGIIAACGHSLRYVLMNSAVAIHIVPATSLAALLIGILAVFISPLIRTPAETCLFPALLPMIPGMYAYKAFGGLAKAMLTTTDSEAFNTSFYLFTSNALTTIFILMAMVIGATLPIFMFKGISFQATRRN